MLVPHRYDITIGRDVMSELGITLDFKDQIMTWDDSTINMKDQKSFPELLDPVNDFSGQLDRGASRSFRPSPENS